MSDMIDITHINEMKDQQKAKIKNDMAKKLNAFDRVAKKAAAKVANSARHNPALREALYTKNVEAPNNMLTEAGNSGHSIPTISGVQVGGFAVFPMPNANGKNRYDIVNMKTQQKIVGDLHLVEGANAIVKLLNKGHSFYSPQVKTILDFESTYTKHYQDAVSFKRKITNNPIKDSIMETRFEESKLKANETKTKLLEFSKKL